MAAPYNPPIKGQDFVFRCSLDDYQYAGRIKYNPPIAAGDFKIDKDGGGVNDLATLPTVDPPNSQLVKISLSATEMNADVVTLIFQDQTDPPAWCDLVISILTTT